MHRDNTLFSSKILCAFLTTLLVLTGCSTVKVQKVPTPTQYGYWSDEMQAKADGIEGFRFYLPRPFLNVFESFPIRTDIYLAKGKLSPDGKSVSIDSVITIESAAHEGGEPKWKKVENSDLLSFDISTKNILVRNNQQAQEITGATQQSSAGGQDNTNSSADIVEQLNQISNSLNKAQAEAENSKEDEEESSNTSSNNDDISSNNTPTGVTRQSVSNDNFAFAYQPMRGNFDIAYVPDFEEQYAITKGYGLGNIDIGMQLGQGWSLQSFNSIVDNSQLNEHLFELVNTGVEAAKVLAGDVFSLADGLAEGIKEVQSDVVAQSGGHISSLADELKGKDGTPASIGAPITLKIVVVHYAAKGFYPIIKPRELQQRQSIKPDKRIIIDTFATNPKAAIGSAAVNRFVNGSGGITTDTSANYTIPKYPYQYISFNTFRYMAIEKIDGDTTPFGELYDKTGTQGEEGAAGSGDLSSMLKLLSLVDKSQNHTRNAQQKFSAEDKKCSSPVLAEWSESYAGLGYPFYGSAPDIFKLNSPILISDGKKTSISGEIDSEGSPSFPAVDGLTTRLKPLVDSLISQLNQDEGFKKLGCGEAVPGKITFTERVNRAVTGKTRICADTSTEGLLKCALEQPIQTKCDPYFLNIEFVAFDESKKQLEVKVLPATKAAFCSNFNIKSLTRLRLVVADHVNKELSAIANHHSVKVFSVKLEEANETALKTIFSIKD